jgi:mannose-6-phosphate isomerase-like protein (cupin superfamily)
MGDGEGIEHPTTGQRFVFRVTAGASGGEAVVFESFLPGYARGLAAGVEAEQEQRFEVLQGTLRFHVGREERLLGAGDRLTVPRGTPCHYWNPSPELAHLVAEIRPALEFEAWARASCTEHWPCPPGTPA